ncbi:hypothetical protein K2Z84_22590 [Candidatus Binatia bacterium]|nr:hypothetical protein [Candidatus Binatia bacterium]
MQSDFVIAGPRLNPNGIGQYLVGSYYDVRPVGVGNPTNVNIQIINTNTNNTGLPLCSEADYANGTDGAGCYNPRGGILAKIRFRESKLSKEVLDFVVPISCGEVWAGEVSLGDTLPIIKSKYPIATSTSNANAIIADDLLLNGQQFVPSGTLPAGVTAADVQHGYIEVIAMEALNCEPDDGTLDISSAETWTRLGVDRTPSNALGAEAFLVRPVAGVSFAYNFTAISAFVGSGLGSIAPQNLFADSNPDWNSCRGLDINLNPYADQFDCVRQANLALSKSRLVSQYDVDPTTAADTNVVVTLPTKYVNCNLNGQGTNYATKRYAGTSFQCAPEGEEISCTLYNREEEFDSPEEPPFSPSEPGEACRLPKELTIINITDDPNVPGILGGFGDVVFNTAAANFDPKDSGWLDLDLVRNASGNIVHREIFPNDTTHDILGAYLHGYRGLPAIGLVAQGFFNGVAGGVYGSIVPSLAEQVVLKPNQS